VSNEIQRDLVVIRDQHELAGACQRSMFFPSLFGNSVGKKDDHLPEVSLALQSLGPFLCIPCSTIRWFIVASLHSTPLHEHICFLSLVDPIIQCCEWYARNRDRNRNLISSGEWWTWTVSILLKRVGEQVRWVGRDTWKFLTFPYERRRASSLFFERECENRMNRTVL
jgi:hypothetical protein